MPLTHTHFIGSGVFDRFSTLVFSLSTNPEYLFDPYIGIMVEGSYREGLDRDYLGIGFWEWLSLANYFQRGIDSERPIYVETFTPYGERVLSQAAGVRMHGNSSRSLPQKSFRLVPRRIYSPESGWFIYDFFPNSIAHDGVPLSRTSRLILRNGSSSWGLCMLRNELGFSLAINAGLLATDVRGASIFLNGEYYGFAWMQMRTDERFLQEMYHASTRNFDIINGYGMYYYIELSTDERLFVDLEMYLSFAHANLLDDITFAELEAILDIDNFLLYNAFNIFVSNDDWPGLNTRRWRYTGVQTSESPDELDGRWRFIIHDLDAAFNTAIHFDWMDSRSFTRLMSRGSTLLPNVLSRTEAENRFVMMMCDISSNVINRQNVERKINELFDDDVWDEIYHWAERWDRCIDTIRREHQIIIDFATYRYRYIFQSLSEYFSFPMDMYVVQVHGGEAIIGTQRGTSSRYFNHLVVPVSPVLPEFKAFYHWTLNGQRIYEPDIYVSLADAIDGYVTLELFTMTAIPPLVIVDAYVTAIGNSGILINPHNYAVRTTGLYLSNSSNNLRMWRIPDATIPPGDTLQVVGRQTIDFSHRFRVQMNFDIREGQILFLSDQYGEILDKFILRNNTEMRDLTGVIQ